MTKMRKMKPLFLLLVGVVLVSGCISTDSTAEVVRLKKATMFW